MKYHFLPFCILTLRTLPINDIIYVRAEKKTQIEKEEEENVYILKRKRLRGKCIIIVITIISNNITT